MLHTVPTARARRVLTSLNVAANKIGSTGAKLVAEALRYVVSCLAVVVAVYSIFGGALLATPIFVGINYFDLGTPITLSPAAGMTVTVTYQIPN